ncbi:unnamed protein product [Allacma fusca]|uniref:Uncharacterized protein n=1 Tax=Allacma fusca TaxID=39272 RepID=A0A8J2KTM9_9HEXA|nr:unnamed protein product [Allacma fusca]
MLFDLNFFSGCTFFFENGPHLKLGCHPKLGRCLYKAGKSLIPGDKLLVFIPSSPEIYMNHGVSSSMKR